MAVAEIMAIISTVNAASAAINKVAGTCNDLKSIEEETDIQKILQTNSPKNKEQKNNYGNAEEFVLKNIK